MYNKRVRSGCSIFFDSVCFTVIATCSNNSLIFICNIVSFFQYSELLTLWPPLHVHVTRPPFLFAYPPLHSVLSLSLLFSLHFCVIVLYLLSDLVIGAFESKQIFVLRYAFKFQIPVCCAVSLPFQTCLSAVLLPQMFVLEYLRYMYVPVCTCTYMYVVEMYN